MYSYDTIITIDGTQIQCVVTSINESEILYVFPYTPNVTRSIALDKVLRIHYENGSVELVQDEAELHLKAANQSLKESQERLNQTMQNTLNMLNRYKIMVVNARREQYNIIVDGIEVGVVNPFKVETFELPLEAYGLLQAVQVSPPSPRPFVWDFRIPRQASMSIVKVQIR